VLDNSTTFPLNLIWDVYVSSRLAKTRRDTVQEAWTSGFVTSLIRSYHSRPNLSHLRLPSASRSACCARYDSAERAEDRFTVHNGWPGQLNIATLSCDAFKASPRKTVEVQERDLFRRSATASIQLFEHTFLLYYGIANYGEHRCMYTDWPRCRESFMFTFDRAGSWHGRQLRFCGKACRERCRSNSDMHAAIAIF
jgi:hypothetical protein